MDITNSDYSIRFVLSLHKFGDDVSVYLATAGRNAFLRFDGTTPEAATVLGAFYRGELRAVESSDPSVVGTRYSGFWDFTPADMAKHSPRGGWMNCVTETATSWFCVHSAGKYSRISMDPFDGADPYTVDGVTFYLGS